MGRDLTRSMLSKIREGVDKIKKTPVKPMSDKVVLKEEDNFLNRAKILMEEAEEGQNTDEHGKGIPITSKTPQFGDVCTTQEQNIVKTIGDQVKFEENALIYYPDADDLVLNGSLPSLNSTFQFRYNDSSGEGVYLFSDGLQLTEANTRTIGKLRDSFINWKQALTMDGDLMDKLKKASER